VQFDGFRAPDYDALAKFIINSWNIKIEKEELATKGWHWGEVTVAKGALQFMVGDKKAFDVPIKVRKKERFEFVECPFCCGFLNVFVFCCCFSNPFLLLFFEPFFVVFVRIAFVFSFHLNWLRTR
jgi:hypothetical protein